MSSNEILKVPADIFCAREVYLNLLPPKSREIYEFAYRRFMNWCKEKSWQSYTEDVLVVYFWNLSTKMGRSSLRAQYSMSTFINQRRQRYLPKGKWITF